MINPIHLSAGLVLLPATWVASDSPKHGSRHRDYADLTQYFPPSHLTREYRPPEAAARAVDAPGWVARLAARFNAWRAAV